MSDPKPDSLLAVVARILEPDIPDPERRAAVASMVTAAVRNHLTGVLRSVFDPYIGPEPEVGRPTVPEQIAAVMLDALGRIAGIRR